MDRSPIAPFLTFNGKAEAAMEFYASVLPGATATELVRYGTERPFAGPDEQDKVNFGCLRFRDMEIMFMDMDSAHPAPDFSWAASLYVTCQTESEFDSIFSALSSSGNVMMGPEPVGNLRKVAWVIDRFGVAWQPVWQ